MLDIERRIALRAKAKAEQGQHWDQDYNKGSKGKGKNTWGKGQGKAGQGKGPAYAVYKNAEWQDQTGNGEEALSLFSGLGFRRLGSENP